MQPLAYASGWCAELLLTILFFRGGLAALLPRGSGQFQEILLRVAVVLLTRLFQAPLGELQGFTRLFG